MSHTMAASECVKGILECDPDISFMPYFFGIQLLHGSLLLLLVAYRLQADSGAAILAACEAVIRATEACFVTLPTDYQVRTDERARDFLAQDAVEICDLENKTSSADFIIATIP